jgi:hypothetical protein
VDRQEFIGFLRILGLPLTIPGGQDVLAPVVEVGREEVPLTEALTLLDMTALNPFSR